MIAAIILLAGLATSDVVHAASALVAGIGAMLIEHWVRSRIADLQAQLAACRASASPVYRDGLPSQVGLYWVRRPNGDEFAREVDARDIAHWSRPGSAPDKYQWAGPLPRPRKEQS